MSNKKKLTMLEGYFERMTTPEPMQGYTGQAKLRSVVTFITADGQKGFFEIRDAVIERIQKLGIQKGDFVSIGFVFIGTEKGDRQYNNLFINQISYGEQS